MCGVDGGTEEEDEGDPICLFCPPDVSESRLRDLAGRGSKGFVVAQEGLKLLTHLHAWLMIAHTHKHAQGGQRNSKSCSFVSDKSHGNEGGRDGGMQGGTEGWTGCIETT